MMKNAIVLLMATALLPLQAVGQITIVGDDGVTRLEYDCGTRSSRIADAAGIRTLKDYSLRLARAAVVQRDTATLRGVMRLYHEKSWPNLEQVIVEQACAGRVIPTQNLPFPNPGSMPPSLEFVRVDGGARLRLSEFAGRVVVVDFWATWCGPCVAQLPRLVSLAARDPDGLVVIAVAYKDSTARVRAWLRRNPPGRVIHVLDPGSRGAEAFEVWGVPSTFVLDEEGRLQVSASNPFNPMALKEFVESLR